MDTVTTEPLCGGLGVTRATLRHWINEGWFPAGTGSGRHKFWPLDTVRAWLREEAAVGGFKPSGTWAGPRNSSALS